MTPRSKIDTHAEAVLEGIGLGLTVDDASARAELDPSTVYDWQQKGRIALALDADSEDVYADFVRGLQRARATLRTRLVERVSKLVPDMETADAIRVLERIDRDRWGKHDRLTIDAGTVRLDDILPAIARYTRGILDDLKLTAEQQQREREIVTKHLAVLSRPADVEG